MPEAALDVGGLRKTYGRGDQRLVAVDDVSFSVQPGEIVGLLGPNGAGKTTLIKCILRLVEPDAGQVRLTELKQLAEDHRRTIILSSHDMDIDR